MRRGNQKEDAGIYKDLEIHQGCDGQPAFDAWGPRGYTELAAGFVITDKEVELNADPDVQREKRELKPAAGVLGVVGTGSERPKPKLGMLC